MNSDAKLKILLAQPMNRKAKKKKQYRGHSTSWHIRAREEVKGQMEL